MHCSICGNEVSKSDNFCGNCGKPLISSNTAEGYGSVNLAGSNTISNSLLHVGDVYQEDRLGETAYIDRTYIKPLKLAGSPVKTSWLIFSGLVGFVGSWASIFSMLGSSWQFLFFIFLVLSMFLLFNGLILRMTRFSRLQWFNLESNEDGEVFLTKIAGSCPKCNGSLKLVDLKVSQNSRKTYVSCTRNSDHVWSFDPTVFD